MVLVVVGVPRQARCLLLVKRKRLIVSLLGVGVASKGGTVSSYSDEQQLDVHYHCLRQGEAMVTITIPVGVYADVVFAWKKV